MYSSLSGPGAEIYSSTYLSRPEIAYRSPLGVSLPPSGSLSPSYREFYGSLPPYDSFPPSYSLPAYSSLQPSYRAAPYGLYDDYYGRPSFLPHPSDGWRYPLPSTAPRNTYRGAPAQQSIPEGAGQDAPLWTPGAGPRGEGGVRFPYPPPQRTYRPGGGYDVTPRLQPYLGLAVQWVDHPNLGKACLVKDVRPGLAADKAGLLADDIIETWDNAPLKSDQDWKRMMGSTQVGRFVRLRIIRNSAARIIYLHIAGADDSTAANAKTRPRLGMGVRWEKGTCVVAKVLPGSAADKAGILAGDIIETWDDMPLHSEDDWKRKVSVMQVGQVVQMRANRNGSSHVTNVTVGGLEEDAANLRAQLGMALRWDDDPRGGRKNACIVIKVIPGSAAEKAGILVGDHIETWDGVPLDSEEDWKRKVGVMRVGQIVRLRVIRQGLFHVTYVHVTGVEVAAVAPPPKSK